MGLRPGWPNPIVLYVCWCGQAFKQPPKSPISSGTMDKESAKERDLPPAARRALAEAAERRKLRDAAASEAKSKSPKELGGPKGEEPTRYGDWERKGIVSDF